MITIKINECANCKSKNIHRVDDGFILCLDCRWYADFEWNGQIDRLSFWIYKKEIQKSLLQDKKQ